MKKKLFLIFLLVLVSFNLFGCEKNNKKDTNETNETNKTEELNLKSDDTKKVYLDNTTYHVYYYDKDGKITGYEQYIQYEYGVTASYIYGDIVEEYKKDSNVDDISPVGSYIKIKYKESKYNKWTLESIKEEVSTYKEIY